MIHEFALEPEVINNWQSFRYFIDQFGAEYGRLISRFPKKWKRMVYDSCSDTEINRARIEIALTSVDRKLVPSGRAYDETPPRTWLDNALEQHVSHPFTAIIARSNPTEHVDVLVADDVDSSIPKWCVPRERKVARRAADLADAIAPLLQVSKSIILVDPFFKPTESRYRRSLKAILEKGLDGHPGVTRLEIHCRSVGNTTDMWRNDCEAVLPAILPAGIELTLVRWEEDTGNDVLHPRYVLTEVGGLRSDYGLDEGAPGETTDICLLSEELLKQRRADYAEESSPFMLVDRITIRSNVFHG